MVGKYDISIGNKRVKYKFTLDNKITVITGDSATGKSTIFRLIQQHDAGGFVDIECKAKIVYLVSNLDLDTAIRLISRDSDNKIFIIDEDFSYLYSKEFQAAINKSLAYFIIIARNPLKGLNYSPNDIYEMYYDESDNTNKLRHHYSWADKFCAPDEIIVEDSKSGFELYTLICGRDKAVYPLQWKV